MDLRLLVFLIDERHQGICGFFAKHELLVIDAQSLEIGTATRATSHNTAF